MSYFTPKIGVSRQASSHIDTTYQSTVSVQGYDEACSKCKSNIEAGRYYLPAKFNKVFIRCYTCSGFTVIKIHRVPKPRQIPSEKSLIEKSKTESKPVSPRTRAATVPEPSKEQSTVTNSPASPRTWAEHFPTSPSEEKTKVTTELPVNQSLDYFRQIIWDYTDYETIKDFFDGLDNMTVEKPSRCGPSKIVPVRDSGSFIIHRIVLPIIHLKNFKGHDWQYNLETKKVTTTWNFSDRHIRGGKQVRSQASSPKSDSSCSSRSSGSSFGESRSQYKSLPSEVCKITDMLIGPLMSYINRLPELPKKFIGGPPSDGKFEIKFTRNDLIYLTDNRGRYWQYDHFSAGTKMSRVTQPVNGLSSKPLTELSPKPFTNHSPKLVNGNSSRQSNGYWQSNRSSPKPFTGHSPKPVNGNPPKQALHFTQRSSYWHQSNNTVKTKSTQYTSKKQKKARNLLKVSEAVDIASGNYGWGE